MKQMLDKIIEKWSYQMKLKILTLNLHCLVEEDLEKKQIIIANAIIEHQIDIVFLQEVAQTKSNDRIVEDNYALTLQTLLEERGAKYNLYFEKIKESFGVYDEGLAFLSKMQLDFVSFEYISKTKEYSNWKSRKLLVYRLNSEKEVFLATTHFGWSDGYEVFEEQFDQANMILSGHERVILAGDFNITPNSKEYQYIINHNWSDIFKEDVYGNQPTFRGDASTNGKDVRIDYIMTTLQMRVISKNTLFKETRVSDHFGILAEIEL